MRNLKRVLSLAMASVMLLGMMVIGAGAADRTALTDLDKVTNKEAVNLMVDLGIIVGKPDGSFAPTETIDRATMSKLIYFIMMGTADESAFKGISTPLTDVKGNWAEGFINYCYSMKIVAGTGNNTYNPNGKVTTVSAAKMLLVALGYDAKLSKYENDAMWSINIMRDAQGAGLLEKVSQKASDELTRDNAAQMIYNALNAKTVTPDTERDMGEAYLKRYIANSTTLGYETYNLVRVTATVTGVASGKATLTNVAPALANSYVNNKLAATNDIVGKNVVIFVKGTINTAGTVTAVEKLISSNLAVGDSVVLASVIGKGISNLTNATTSSHKDFLAVLEDAPVGNNLPATVTYYVNGAADVSGVRYGNGTADAAAGGTNAGGSANATTNVGSIVAKKGVIVEFVDTDNNGKANIVKITDKTVGKVTAKVETKVVDGKTQVKVPGLGGLSSFNSNNTTSSVFGFEDLAKDDIVLFYTANGNYYIEKADSFSGQLTATKSGTDLIISGTTYKVTGLGGVSKTFAGVVAEGYNKDVTYWLDNGGNVVFAQADEETKAEYAIVTGWRNAGSFGEISIEAKLLMADGTLKTVKVSKFAATETGALADITSTTAFGTGLGIATENAPGAVPVAYSIDKDGNYRLNKIDGTGDNSVVALTNAAVHNNKAVFVTDANNDGTVTDTLTGNSKTAFLIKDGSKIETLTGIANAPKYTAGPNGAVGVALVDKDGITVMVYITAGVNEGTSTTVDRAYIIDNTSRTYYPAVTGSHDAYYEYDAIVAGDKTTIKVLVGSAAASDITANTIYALTLNKDGLVTGVTRSTGWDTGVKYLDGVVRVGASSYYTYESASKIYVIDGDSVNTVNAADIAEDAQASVLFVQKNATDVTVIKELYIVKNNVDLPTALALSATGGTATVASANNELLTEQGIVTSAAATNTVTVTSTTAAGTTAEVKISGAGTTITGTDAANGTATYTLVAGDIGSTLTVTVKVTETATGATQTLKYQIKVS